jgi:hypothetical protein
MRGEPLASRVRREQTLDIGKAGEITQNVVPSPGSAVPSVTSANSCHTNSGFLIVLSLNRQ